MEEQVRLSRPGVTVPWGFRLQGGADFNQRLVVQRVAADGIAARAQIKLGDVLVKVNGVETLSLTHKQACDLVGAAELQLVLTIVRQHNAHRLWTRDGFESRDSAVVTSAPVPQTTEATIAGANGASQQQQQQIWLPSSELVRRASVTLTPSPLSPRAPRRAPWDRTPSQSEHSEAEQYPALPLPPPLVIAPAPTPLGNKNQTVGGTATSAAAASLLGAQLQRLQLKSPQPLTPPESEGAVQSGTAPPLTAAPIPFALQREGSRAAAGSSVVTPAVAATTTTAPRRGSNTPTNGSATYDRTDAGAERETSARTFSSKATATAIDQASWPQTLTYRRDSGGNLIQGIQPAHGGPTSATGKDESAASAPKGQLPQQEPRRSSQSAAENGGGQRAAYFIQPGGVVTALQWNDRPLSPDVDKSAVLAALREEQELGVGGSARRRSSSSNKHGYSFRVLQLITGTADDDENTPDDDGALKIPINASSTATTAATVERTLPASPMSPTGSVFSSSPKETSTSGGFGLRRHVSPFQDDYSDF